MLHSEWLPTGFHGSVYIEMLPFVWGGKAMTCSPALCICHSTLHQKLSADVVHRRAVVKNAEAGIREVTLEAF